MTARTDPVSAPQFTPGRWERRGSGSILSVKADGSEEKIARCFGMTSPQMRADANLIAAAPELYEGCNALLGLLQLLLGRDDLPDDVRDAMQTSHRVEEAKAAVAKARGGQ